MKQPKQEYERLDLVAGSQGCNGLEETGFSVRQLTSAIFRLLAAYGADQIQVMEGVRSTATLNLWKQERSQAICFRYRCSSGGTIWLGFPTTLFNLLLERFYGGNGVPHQQADDVTRAQRLFAIRLSSDLEKVIFAAWPGDTRAQVIGSHIMMWDDQCAMPSISGAMSVVDITVSESAASADAISLGISPEHIAAFRVPSAEVENRSGVVEGNWKARLVARAHHVPLPVRAILAQPEIPAGRLLTIKAGDFLPLAIPKSVTVHVNQQLFARGVVGESQGNSAIRLEQLAMGIHR